MPRPRVSIEHKREVDRLRSQRRRDREVARRAEAAANEIAEALAAKDAIEDWDQDDACRVGEALLKHRRTLLREMTK